MNATNVSLLVRQVRTPPEARASSVSLRGDEAARAARASRTGADGGANWRQDFARKLFASDLLVLIAVVVGAQLVWFGTQHRFVAVREDSAIEAFSYWGFSALLVLLWMWALGLADSRAARIVGTGGAEFVALTRASVQLFGALAIVAFLLRIDLARGYLLLALPIGVLALTVERAVWRGWLQRRRRAGEYTARVLLIGTAAAVNRVTAELRRAPRAGYVVAGACVPCGRSARTAPVHVPLLGDIDDVEHVLASGDIDTVAFVGGDAVSPHRVKEISWNLEPGGQHLVMAPGILDVAGPRLHARPVAGLPFIHVEIPTFTRAQLVAKRVTDVVLGCLALLAASPVLLALAIVVRASSKGAALFTQERIGLHGEPFTIYKFRTMVSDAEQRRIELEDERDAGNRVLFKLKDDPRVTRVGRLLRRYSLDELPQLFNVIGGSMSLVGPRPPLASEVELYERHVHRRFLVKPGMTGLWQVSGRSSLSWEDSVRLDLSYVENWTWVADVVIMLKTVRAVVQPGATAF